VAENKSGLNILTELYSFYHRISELSFTSDSISYHCDLGWAFLECYKDDDDKELWEKLVENEQSSYMSELKKLSCITLLLFKYKAIKRVTYEHRIHAGYTDAFRKGNIEFTDQLDFMSVLIRHKQMQQIMSKEGMDVTFHLDVCIAMLMPYFTEEDMYMLERIAHQDVYTGMILKEKLISVVMDRAEMLFGRGMLDTKGGRKWRVPRPK